MKKEYIKPTIQVEVMTESFEILAGSISEVTRVDSNLEDDDDLDGGGAGNYNAR